MKSDKRAFKKKNDLPVGALFYQLSSNGSKLNLKDWGVNKMIHPENTIQKKVRQQ